MEGRLTSDVESSPIPAIRVVDAVSRVAGISTEAELLDALVDGACACFDAADAVVVTADPDGAAPSVATGARADTPLDAPHPLLHAVLVGGDQLVGATGVDAADLAAQLVGHDVPGRARLARLDLPHEAGMAVIALFGLDPDDPGRVDPAVMVSFARAAAASLSRVRLARAKELQAEQHHALSRAAHLIGQSLDPAEVTANIAHEARSILGADLAVVYRRTPDGGAAADHAFGLGPRGASLELGPGEGLAGQIMLDGRARMASDYRAEVTLPAGSPMAAIRSALGAPMRWDGGVRGSLTVGYFQPRELSRADLDLLEAFADLAASAFANAHTHADLIHAARTDSLTGCLNHGALQQALRLEIERSRRTHQPLSVVLVDLDHFKDHNDRHGHLAGDEALRRIGATLRAMSRPYDLVARFGGDEFLLVLVDADEQTAAEVAGRTLEQLDATLSGALEPGTRAATLGVAEWARRQTASDLIGAADRALLFARRRGKRGVITCASDVPTEIATDGPRATRTAQLGTAVPQASVDDRLRKRSQQLALANGLGTRLAAMNDRGAILETVAEELHRAFGFFNCAIVAREDGVVHAAAVRGDPFIRLGVSAWSQSEDVGLIGRCLRTGRSVLCNDVTVEPEYVITDETVDVRSELIVPVTVDGSLWGVINLEERELGAFDIDDLALAETIAAQLGAALRSARYYDRLERAYVQTAAALAGALEAKDAYTADHAREIAEQAAEVARRMGVEDQAVREIRLAAVLHDIGKIAVPEQILNKPGPLTDEEFDVVKQHTIVGAQILAPVESLAGVRPMVRHEHERWDGNGYPDGLSGERIPLGSRIILACDALHAMTSDRPYRKAMPAAEALEELRRHAGTQFDPAVVATLLDVLAEGSAAEPPARRAG